ncbi:MAG: exonuclease domain-containing protein [Coriobacteriia bacterium]|nr:exonuclease domain-containing protein [Coriobacteriia bacterium]
MLAGTPLNDGDFVTVDIETTGCRPGTNDIIEIGAVRIRSGVIVARFGELVRPTEPIPPSIKHLTGIDEDMVADADEITSVMRRFREFVGESVLIAHNHRFDLGFLDYEAERAWGHPFPRPVLDTLILARRLHPELERHNLRALAQTYQVDTVPDHRATTDAMATAEVWCLMLAELAKREITTAGDVARFCGLARQGDLARKLVLATNLPDAPGVYVMRDAEGAVLHVGRAKSLRTRVRSYFYAPVDKTSNHPAVLTTSVSHVVCASQLDAQLLESRLVLRYHPRLDRDHERGRSVVYVHADITSRFPRLRVTNRRYATGTNIGPLTNLWAAETLVEALRAHYGLRRCIRRLDDAGRSRACPRRTDGSCPHPCDGGITAENHRDRIDAALEAFDGQADRFRTSLQGLRESAAADQRYEDAIAYRDALRAVDRTMSALKIVREAATTRGLVIMEGDERTLVLHLVRHGYLAHTLRVPKEELGTDAWEARLLRAVRRAHGGSAADPARDTLTPRQLRDIFLIHTYREQNAPPEVRFNGDPDDLTRRVILAARRFMRVPHTRHADVLGG